MKKKRAIKIFALLLKHDVIEGVYHNKNAWIITTAISVISLLVFYSQIMLLEGNVRPTLTDTYLYLFRGMAPYLPELEKSFPIPVQWLSMNLTIAFWIFGYTNSDLSGNGCQLLVRCKSRFQWWLSKVVWSLICVLHFYILIFVFLVVFTFICGIPSFQYTQEINQQILSLNALFTFTQKHIILMWVMPVLSSFAMACFQLCVEIWTRPIFSYLTMVICSIASAYYYHPFFMGGSAMLQRSSLFMQDGFLFYQELGWCFILAFLSLFGGYFKLRRRDIQNTTFI